MAKMTKCYGGDCPLKPTCHRYTKSQSTDFQPYFGWPPFTFVDGEVSCEMYWGDGQQKLKDLLMSINIEKEK
jgi:hypothetical protein